MQSDYTCTRISDGEHYSLHTYFDVCPESPDGQSIVHSRFVEDTPRQAQMVVTDRYGKDATLLGAPAPASIHRPLSAQWMSNTRLLYSLGSRMGKIACVDRESGATRIFPGALNIYSEAAGAGFGVYKPPAESTDAQQDGVVCRMEMDTEQITPLFTMEDCRAVHPWGDDFDNLGQLNFQHAKPSPDGKSVFIVLTNERYRLTNPDPRPRRVKSLLIADADGANLRYFREFGHHPMWTPDGLHISAFDFTEENQDFVLHPLDGGPPKIILENTDGIHPSFSSDMRYLVFDVFHRPNEPGDRSIELIDMETNTTITLAKYVMPPLPRELRCHPHPVWSRDEKRVYFNSAESGTGQLYAVEDFR